jgi:HAD superfamily hydrolase (TIGR01509 family)
VTAAIFDCDGTLVDSEPLAGRAWKHALARHGYALAADDLAGAQGLPFPRVYERIAKHAALPDVETFWRDYAAELLPLLDRELETFPDAIATARELRKQSIPLAVASSSRRARLDRTLACVGLDGFFAVSVAGDEIEHGKPAPDMFLAVAERLGVEPAECVVIEDSTPGVQAGLAASVSRHTPAACSRANS